MTEISMSGRRTLLGRLAGVGWFARHGEVAATSALAILLEDEPLHVAFLDHLQARTGIDLSAVSRFKAEVVAEDQARVDLEGQDEKARPWIKVEAKFAEEMTQRQFKSFVADQVRRLGPDRAGVFVALVPAHRVPEASTLLASPVVVAAQGEAPVQLVTMTWDEVLASLRAGASSVPAVGADVDQFADLCLTLQGLDIRPFGDAAEGGTTWRQREPDLQRIVERVTAELSAKGVRLLPTGRDSLFSFRRYFPAGLPGCYAAVGIVERFADEGGTPLWLRFHSATAGFAGVSERVRSSDLGRAARADEGHLWLPLTVPTDVSGAGVVRELVDQVRRVIGEVADS